MKTCCEGQKRRRQALRKDRRPQSCCPKSRARGLHLGCTRARALHVLGRSTAKGRRKSTVVLQLSAESGSGAHRLEAALSYAFRRSSEANVNLRMSELLANALTLVEPSIAGVYLNLDKQRPARTARGRVQSCVQAVIWQPGPVRHLAEMTS